MKDLTMQRYQIALDRGFKGGFKEFCRQNRVPPEETPAWKRERSMRRGSQLEKYVVALVKAKTDI